MGGYAPAGTILQAVVEEKDIGVIIFNTLKPSSQCAAAVKKELVKSLAEWLDPSHTEISAPGSTCIKYMLDHI